MNRSCLSLSTLLAALPCAAAEPVFETQVIDPAIAIGYGLAICDVDGDGKDDVLLADAREIVWYRNSAGGDWKKHVIARNLTLRDNVCIAARDLDGDGKAEIAVGAQWNPGETSDDTKSGAVFWLQRPAAGDGEWTPVPLPSEPTVHRMHFVRLPEGKHALIMLPLHGRGNRNGEGPNGSRALLYPIPEKPSDSTAWQTRTVDDTMHITHNFDLQPDKSRDILWIGGKEGLLRVQPEGDALQRSRIPLQDVPGTPDFGGIGEVRTGRGPQGQFIATVEPFHGPMVAVYSPGTGDAPWTRSVIDNSLNQGHALACADLLGQGQDQIIAGWREPDAQGHSGIRIYRQDAGTWSAIWTLPPGQMACEDLKIADLNSDGKPDIIAAGRATKNVIILWNRSK